MSVVNRGDTATITYQAINNQEGLEDITAIVFRPVTGQEGPFSLVEYSPGFYRFFFTPSLSDPTGDYIGLVRSPSENNEAQFKISVVGDSGGGSSVNSQASEIVGVLDTAELLGSVESSSELVGIITEIIKETTES